MTLEELDRLNRGNNLISKITELEQIVKDLDNGIVYLCDVNFSSIQSGFAVSGCSESYKYALNTKRFKDGLNVFVKNYLKREIECRKLEFEKL